MAIIPNWTQDEVNYLENSWGSTSIKMIAKKLNRSIDAIKLKAHRIGLDDARFSYDGITVSQLMQALGKTYSSVYQWIRDYGMPVKTKVFCKKARVKVISYQDFWEWAEQYKELLNLAKLEENMLGAEPDWAKVKRRADQQRSQKTWQSVHWTPGEDQLLKQMVGLPGMTYPKLAAHFNRTESATRRRLYDLNIKMLPERLNNHIKYTVDEVRILALMARQGHGYETIAKEIGKSALGVRGKLERMNFDFKKREFRDIEILWKLTKKVQ